MPPKTIIDMFEEAVETKSRPDALRAKQDGCYHSISSLDALLKSQSLAAGLIELGVAPKDRVALLSENRPEWMISDIAILASRAINVPIYPTLPAVQVEQLLNNAGVKFIILSNKHQLSKIKEIQKRVPSLEGIVVIDLDEAETEILINYDTLTEKGAAAWQLEPSKYQEVRDQVQAEDVATIIYTSGTTGSPKGVMLTHSNIVSNVLDLCDVLYFDKTDVVLSFLPLSHIFERTADYLMFFRGVSLAYAESVDKVPVNMLEIRPTVVACVPRFFEKLHNRIMESRQQISGLKNLLSEWAFGVGHRYMKYIVNGTKPPAFLSLQKHLASNLVFSKLRNRLGGRLRFFISGGAPLDKSLAEFFFSIEVLILEGYGLTETSPVITINRPNAFKFGTVGLPLDSLEVKLADDGEILTRGPSVMVGYYKKETETQQVLQDGWFNTGDIGHLDQDGFLKITDRKKDLIVTTGGKKISPQRVEGLLKANPIFLNAVVVGEKRAFVSALVVPRPELVIRYAEENGLEFSSYSELLQSSEVKAFLLTRVQQATTDLASFEKIKKIILLEKEFSIESEELTPTLKVRRGVIENRFRNQIEAIYKE